MSRVGVSMSCDPMVSRVELRSRRDAMQDSRCSCAIFNAFVSARKCVTQNLAQLASAYAAKHVSVVRQLAVAHDLQTVT